jgi:hypothetical protein
VIKHITKAYSWFHWIKGWMGPTAGIDIIAKEEVPVTKQDATEDHVT